MTLKLVHSNDDSPKALGMKIAKANKSITNGAISHYGDIVKADYLSGICGHIEWTTSSLQNEVNNAAAYALMGLEASRSVEEKNKALRMIREALLKGLDHYKDALEIKRTDHEVK